MYRLSDKMCTFAHRYIILWREQNNEKRSESKQGNRPFIFLNKLNGLADTNNSKKFSFSVSPVSRSETKVG